MTVIRWSSVSGWDAPGLRSSGISFRLAADVPPKTP
jgi:hypothetical protein